MEKTNAATIAPEARGWRRTTARRAHSPGHEDPGAVRYDADRRRDPGGGSCGGSPAVSAFSRAGAPSRFPSIPSRIAPSAPPATVSAPPAVRLPRLAPFRRPEPASPVSTAELRGRASNWRAESPKNTPPAAGPRGSPPPPSLAPNRHCAALLEAAVSRPPSGSTGFELAALNPRMPRGLFPVTYAPVVRMISRAK